MVTSQTALAGEVAPAQFDNATENPYREAWDTVRDKYGLEIAGRHIVALGFRNAETGAVREPTRAEVVEATARLRVALNPPPAPEPVYEEPVESTSYSPAPVASGSGCPASMFPESGSAGYSAVNPSSGAEGCYQTMPFHRDPGGSCYGLGMDPASQDACAAILCSESGAEPWASSGANPC